MGFLVRLRSGWGWAASGQRLRGCLLGTEYGVQSTECMPRYLIRRESERRMYVYMYVQTRNCG